MAQKVEDPTERPLQSFTLKDFLAVNTTNSRVAVPQNAFYDLENAQPIGSSNLHSINDISGVLHSFGADTVYTDQDCNLGGTEWIVVATTNGKLFSYNVATSAVTQINGAFTLSGNGTFMAQYQNSNLVIIDSTGYFQWPGSGNIVSLGGTTGAPSSGQCIAVYQNRVWIAAGRLLYYSAPASFSDFQTASGGGFSSLVDGTLRSNVTQMLSCNGYLYYWGTTSINAISDLYVPTGASPPTPNFTNLNITAIVGTDQPYSVQTYGRLVLFANRYGVWSLYGTSVQTISGVDPNNQYQSSIDGTWQYVDFTQTVSGGQFISNNLLCAAFLIKRLNDPVFGSNTVIAIYQGNAAGGRWWFANPGGTVTRVTTAIASQSPALFSYIGNNIQQLFFNASSSPPATVSTPLWDFGDPITQKEVLRAGIGLTTFVAGAGITSFTLDTSTSSIPINLNTLGGSIVWVNNSNAVVTWVNNVAAPVAWIPSSVFLTYWGQAPKGFSKYVGLTLKTSQGMVWELNALLLDYKWAARWTGN